MGKFDEVYRELNAEQRQAVDAIEGPVLVLAGPGTGKTQLLSARVANILTQTDTDASNVVCLTFTVNAANNMRERLRGMIGSDANHVVIKTFHSLAADIIASHPEHFYAGAVLNPISELAAQEILQNIFESLPHDSPLAARYDGKYIHLNNALQAIGRVKDAGMSPEKLQAALDTHLRELDAVEPDIVDLLSGPLNHKALPKLAESLEMLAEKHDTELMHALQRLFAQTIEADLPTGKTTLTGKLKGRVLSSENGQKVMARERRANAWWQALHSVYTDYQKTLYKRGYMDYSDMLVMTIDALEKSEDLRLDIQETTQYLLVDEFQDSNEAQIKLLHLMVDNPHIDHPNVMVVGDPNQTIYGFNGAMLDNTTDFQQHYQAALTTVDLTQNYRSSQLILDESRSVITPYTSFHPELHAENEPADTAVSYITHLSPTEQSASICQGIVELMRTSPAETIAILARSHASLSLMARSLAAHKISVNYDQSIDIRTTSCNQLIITTLSLIQAITTGDRNSCDHALSELLRHPVFGLSPEAVWHIALQANRNTSWLDIASKDKATAPLIDWANHLVSVNASQPLHVVVEQLLAEPFAPGKTIYQELFAAEADEQLMVEAQAVKQLLELAKQYAGSDHVSLESFLTMLRETNDRLFMFSPSTGQYSQAVTLMSVHGAKGLEFDHVYIIDADEAHWKPKPSRYPTPLSLPIHVNLDTPADYARLLYVAMTRAKQSLHISYVSQVDTKTTALPAEQLSEKKFTAAPEIPGPKLLETEIAQLIPYTPRPKSMQELLSKTLESYRLSATALTHFLDLSREGMDTFIEEQLLRLPQPTSEALAHGNAMHAAMELAQIQATNSKPDLAALKRLYRHKIQEESLTAPVIERLIARADEQLDRMFGEFGLKLDPTSLPEQSFSAITASGVSMYGKIDRIDAVDDETVRIVDYKTGKPITNPASKAQDVLLKQWRHKLQLGFYALLLRQQKPYKSKNITAQIIQLDATSPDYQTLDYEFDDAELDRIEHLAHAVYTHITTLDIPDVTAYAPTLSGIRSFEDKLLSKPLHKTKQ
jgi:DNA helicase-2/ATP-dependent DNA helicase PcrA